MKLITGAAYLVRIKPPQSGRVIYKVKGVGGMRLAVSSTGRMTWQLIDRLDMKQTAFTLGNYSESENGLSLAEACDKARDWKRRIRTGDDPRTNEKAEKARKKDTFADIRTRFMIQYVNRNLKPNTIAAYESVLNSGRLKEWENKPIKTITRGDVIALIDSIADEGREVMANRTLAYLRKFFNWCAEKDIIRAGEPIPTDRVKQPLKKEKARDRYLSAEEVKLFWEVTGEVGYPYGPVYRFFLLTGQRKTECADIRQRDLEDGLWDQGENKSGREHIVPLNELALNILQSCPQVLDEENVDKDYVFTIKGDKPINGFSKSKARLDVLLAEKAKEQGIVGAFHEPWQIHDLRRTMTTHLRKAGISRDVCSLLLNHAEKGVTAEHYDKYDMLPEKKQAMDAWGSLLNEFFQGRADNVVRLSGNDRI